MAKQLKGFVDRDGVKHNLPIGEGGGSYDDTEIREALDGKASKDTEAVEGNFAAFDSEGNPVDSDKKAADFAEANHEHYKIGTGLARVFAMGNNGSECIQLFLGHENTRLSQDEYNKSVTINRSNIENLVRLLTYGYNNIHISEVSGLMDVINSLQEEIAELRAEISQQQEEWTTIEELTFGQSGVAGQNKYSQYRLMGLSSYAQWTIGDRIRLVSRSNNTAYDGTVIGKNTGPNTIAISIDLDELANGVYDLQKLA